MKKYLFKGFVMVCLVFILSLSYGNLSKAVSMEFKVNDSDKKTVTITQYDGDMQGIRIPQTVTSNGIEYTVTAIGNDAFHYNSDLMIVEIPETIVSIGNNSFYKCDNLVQVRFEGGGIRSIGDYAFYQCKKLSSVTFGGDGLQSIGEYAFFECALTSFVIPSTVTKLGRAAFGYAQFSSIDIPGSVTSYGEGLFYSSDKLKRISFGEGITTLWMDALGGCDSITSVTLPNSLQVIEKGAFSGENKLQELVIPEGVVSIKADAFYELTINTLKANCPNVVLEEGALKGLDIKTLYCYYNSPFYHHFIEDDEVKIILIDNPMVITNPSIIMGVTSQEKVNLIGDGNIIWKSSNKKVATVNSKGVVTAKKQGTVTITASCDGKTATCKVKVKANERKLKPYSKKVSKYVKNRVGVCFAKVKQDKKGNYIVTGHFLNTTKKSYSRIHVQIAVFKDSHCIAKESFSNIKVKSKARSLTPVTFKIKKKNIEKNTNLCNGNITADVRGLIFCK